jgi:hypothetical protein
MATDIKGGYYDRDNLQCMNCIRLQISRKEINILVGGPKGKGPLGTPRRRWEDNVKMDLRGCCGLD